MIRSLFSAVSGMKAHQTKLDVIGNNIANVNTYGFKSSRARFQDVFYQTLESATGGTATKGGTNASQVGYGAQLGGIDLNTGRSALQSTDRPMDVAITGDGFFQVQDADGNIFYTRAGILSIDPNSGNLIDANGNAVLGVTGDPLGKAAGSDKIHLSMSGTQATRAQATQLINGINFSITAENTTKDGNTSINFKLDPTLPDGSDIKVKPGDMTSGSITVSVNPTAVFSSLEDFNKKMNTAITEGRSGVPHPAGNFTIQAVPGDKLFPAGGLTGKEVLESTFGAVAGTNKLDSSVAASGIFGGIFPESMSTSPKFTAAGTVTYSASYRAADPDKGTLAAWVLKAEVAVKQADGSTVTRTFEGEVNSSSTVSKTVLLKEVGTPGGEEEGQYIELKHQGFEGISSAYREESGTSGAIADGAAFTSHPVSTITAASDSRDLGLGSKIFVLEGGTESGNVAVSNDAISILANGIVQVNHPTLGNLQLGRIDLVTFENPNGLEEVGNSYFRETANSGAAQACEAGTNGTGGLKTSALEMSNVDLSSEFSDMIVTQRGFQANSRIITVSDSILEELVNLKR
ncbi:flagellar hook protein FlgE [Diplocloster agilis]|uniref:Flagellar hook protein FlgE n=1 Tax=Diplocloster agilis TaxID=2850323 RepID=A0A949NJ14_9FIRM|nr:MULTISPECIES: flagellar hook-basal body complex protein [Lachnospiraceae]MBU9739290.1 flagellar hook-basal body complex protein [Diplocloster agilis]MBU9744673.1 flagellar hook-basal body complex protein [Diplocloster agilis]MCU6734544.1 flagellar hook-basal body complex protein [Suonthocola fibrivorans]SCJ44151.1 Distal rod protein [uncultured Clostridium sp.]